RQFFQRLSERRPLVLVFEDLHWADRSSINLLQTLMRSVPATRLLRVLVGRPEFPETLDFLVERARAELPDRVVELVLAQLTAAQCEAPVRTLRGGGHLPCSVRAHIVGRADGNPFFVEEAVRSLIDSGAVVRREGRF